MAAQLHESIKSGLLAKTGLLCDEDITAAVALIDSVKAKGIETVRIVFADAHGILRGKTVVADALAAAFTSGIRVPSTLLLKDTSHRTVFPVWSDTDEAPMRGASDVLLTPVPSSFQQLPWSEHSAMLHCNVNTIAGEPIVFSSRQVLATAVDQLAQRNFKAIMGLEVEFQVFELLNPAREHVDTTMPGQPPTTRAFTQGFQYLTETRYGEAEELLDLLRRTAQGMNMPVRSVEIEMGPSQFEFTFAPADPMTIADMAVNFRTMVKEVCFKRGLHATFMAKPRLPNAAANGWHIHQSLVDTKTGSNQFMPQIDQTPPPIAENWIAGLLASAAESCLMTTPTVNGYKRYAPFQLAPNKIGWAHDNRGAMVRVLVALDDNASRVENRVADSSCNPYFALAAQLISGTDGLERQLNAPAPLVNPYNTDAEGLPANLQVAIERFQASTVYRHYLGDEFVDYLVNLKRAEWERYLASVSEWEQMEYFSTF